MSELGGYAVFTGAGWPVVDALGLDRPGVHGFSLARHCLRAVCGTVRPARLWLPNFTCPSVRKVAEQLGTSVSYYQLGEGLTPKLQDVGSRDLCVINHYFGLSARLPAWTSALATLAPERCVIDNTQSLGLSNPFPAHWSFLSPRKFLPVTDGGILYTAAGQTVDPATLPDAIDQSWSRTQWLFRAIDEGGRSASYAEYLKFRQEEVQSIAYAQMSAVTRHLLARYDVAGLLQARNRRFEALRRALPIHPEFRCVVLDGLACPIGFPVQVPDAARLQAFLAGHRIYAVRYWPELAQGDVLNDYERALLDRTVLLPLDADYSETHMSILLEELTGAR
jgi:hypothetical protein